MHDLIQQIHRIAEKIRNAEKKRTALARFLLDINPAIKLVQPIPEVQPLNARVIGVDGGIVKKSFHGFDFMLVRAAAVCFLYKNNKVEKVEYHPSRSPEPEPELFESISDLEWNYLTSLCRLQREMDTATQSLEMKPDILLLDGLILPHYSDRPSKSSRTYHHYDSLIRAYKNLFEQALENRVMLAGVVKDSRSSMFCDFIKNEILSQVKHTDTKEIITLLAATRDTALLHRVLKKGERSRLFAYSKTPAEHPVLKDMQQYSTAISSFYLKTAQWDRPIRIDVLIPEGEDKDSYADYLASAILSISGHHAGYGIPAPLIEADNIAKLSDTELEDYYYQIVNLTGHISSTMDLRRAQRPF